MMKKCKSPAALLLVICLILSLSACGGILKEVPGLCGCCIDAERGVLKVTDVTPKEYPPILPILPEGSYHLYDYQFFFRNLQQNVGQRINSYIKNIPGKAA